jgi:hypothetical protein
MDRRVPLRDVTSTQNSSLPKRGRGQKRRGEGIVEHQSVIPGNHMNLTCRATLRPVLILVFHKDDGACGLGEGWLSRNPMFTSCTLKQPVVSNFTPTGVVL